MSIAAIEAELLAPDGPFATQVEPVLGEPMRVFTHRPRSLAQLVAASLAHGDAEHLVFTDGSWEHRISFREHGRLVAQVARSLRDRFGVGRGDRVAIAAANCPEWLLTFWATVSLGGVVVALNAWWAGPELRQALVDSAPKVLIGDRRRLARLERDPGIPVVTIEDDFAALCVGTAELPRTDIAEDDPAIILYTSGTTARAKGAVHSHRNVIGLVGLGFFHGLRLRRSVPPPPRPPCSLVTSPLFHVSGLHSAAVAALAGGIKTVWPMGRFDAGLVLELMERERVTAWGYTQTVLHRLLRHADASRRDLSAMYQLGGGGSPIPPELQERARQLMPTVAATLGVGYGLTECTALATLNFGAELAVHPRSVGRPLPTVEIDLREGEVYVRSPLVMLGYWNDPVATSQAILPQRWLRTGDMGRLEDGRLYLDSRKRDLILRGGENVYPVEIEQRLEQHPAVAEAAVVGVAHDELGQEIKAIVVPVPGRGIETGELAAWVALALAGFKVPVHWELRAAPLPRNAVGKIMKHALASETEFIED